MKIISRTDAKATGLKRYFTGKPCPHGHVCERYVSSYTCVECSQACAIKWAKSNPDKAAKTSNKYRTENQDKVKARYAEWYSKNGDYHQKWREENRQSTRDATSRWRSKNREKVLEWNRNRRAKLANASGTHTSRDVEKILKKQKFKCPSCLAGIRRDYHVDHVMPLALGGSNSPENIQCLCPTCNVRKQAQDPIVWANSNGRLL